MAELGFNTSIGFLEQGNDSVYCETAEGKRYKANAIAAFQGSTRHDVFIAHWPSALATTKLLLWWKFGATKGENFSDPCIYKLRRRLESGLPEKEGRDLFVNYKYVANQNLHFRELIQEAGVLLNAGSVSATSMTNILYLLIKKPHTMKKLREEVDAALEPDTVIETDVQVNDLKYLRACIGEAFRHRPPTVIGLRRQCIEKATTVAGHRIAAGVTVSVPTYTN